jgi:Amt family ammonium transporter
MIIVTILWVVIGFGLSFGPSIGIIGFHQFILSSVGPNTAWSLNHTVSIIRFIPSKFAIITPALITEPLLNEFVLGLYAIHGSFILLIYAFMSYDLASRQLFFQDGSAGSGGTVVFLSAGH